MTKSGLVVPSGLFDLAATFVVLQDARQQADYNFAVAVTHAQAEADVGRVETVFTDWPLVEAHPASNDFLAELWCRGIPKRS